MATHVPCKKNDANGYVTYVSLISQSNAFTFQANPTLAAGDAKIAIDDGAPANLGTLPAVDGDFTKRVKVVLSQAETNGDVLTIIFSDAAGSEWCDLFITIHTAAQTMDEMDTNVDSILTDTAEIGAAGAGLTAVVWNSDWDAEVQSECQDAIEANNLDHLLKVADADDVVNDTVIAKMVSKDATADWSDFDNTTESLEALKDGVLADILTDTGTTLDGKINTIDTNVDGIKSITDDLQGIDEVADAVWNEATSGHVAVGSTGLAIGSLYSTLVVRVAQCGDAGTGTTIDLDASASAVTDFYKGQLIAIVLGTGAGQARTCTGYNGTSKIATVSPSWATNPDGNSYFAILNTGSTVAVDWADGGRLDTILDAILVDTAEIGAAGVGLTDLGGMSTTMKAQVNAEAKDVIATDTISEIAQGAPAATPTLVAAVMELYMTWRNKTTTTKTELGIYNDAGTKVHKATLSDDNTTFTKAELGSGA
jgi:hypothetical protein